MRWALPLNASVPVVGVIIDAGHGGSDIGADPPGQYRDEQGNTHVVYEKVVNLAFARELKQVMLQHPVEQYSPLVPVWAYKVCMTRTSDVTIETHKRREIIRRAAEDKGYKMLVSLHSNNVPYKDGKPSNPDKRGVQVYYCQLNPFNSRQLADNITAMVRALLTQDEAPSVETLECMAAKRGFHFWVLYKHKVSKDGKRYWSLVPAVLIELGFLSNQQDAKQLDPNRAASADYRYRFCDGIHRGCDSTVPHLR